MPKRFLRLIRYTLAAFLILPFFLTPEPARAAIANTNEAIQNFNQSDKLYNSGSIDSTSYTTQNLSDVQTGLLYYLGGKTAGFNVASAPGASPFADRGAYGSIISLVGDMYGSPPASVETYVADVMHDMKINVAQPAYAQGVGLGFSALNPILAVWKMFRNLAYFGFVVIFLVIGFMIMFRQKIGSQAVVTAEQAIPKIVIALVLVTFSYAIAGFLIDIMYLSMYLIAGLLDPKSTDLIQGNVFSIVAYLMNNGAVNNAASAVADLVNNALGQGFFSNVAAVVSGLTAAVIVFLVIIFNAFRLFIALLKVYVDIILAIAFAPIVIMMEALPGNNSFVPWLKRLAADLAVFPAILILLAIFVNITAFTQPSDPTKAEGGSVATGAGFVPPYLSGGAASSLPFLAGLALILALPEAVEQVQKMGGAKAGIFETLIQAGLSTAGKTADVAIPLSTGGMNAAYGGLRAGREILRSEQSERGKVWHDLLHGRETTDSEGHKQTVGGILRKGASGIRIGQSIRRQAEGARELRFLDPDNLYNQLNQIRQAQLQKAPKAEEIATEKPKSSS